ncbi:glycosyltransferase [Bacillus thuringiensis]|uniref:glycosyltransferase n=1 Tax=Bacillus thuringiensis TaxID=1428 RepID=UPI000BFAA27D|nr:glycosyltransferase [Bacillus thuringiensis]PFV94922.1 glycosyl transferase [Bacillus thuringiensis]PGQ47061.1 glycosyl transferase [Bacillus thuringiensis]
MKNILFVIPYLGGGGAERVLIDLINTLNKKNIYNITIFTIGSGILDDQLDKEIRHVKLFNVDLANQDIISKIKIRLILKLLKILSPSKMRKFISIFLKESFDIEVAFLEGFPIKFVSQSSAMKIGWIHTDLKRFNYCRAYFKNKINELDTYSSMNKLIFVSETSKVGYLEYFEGIRNQDNLYVLKNILNIERIMSLSKEEIEFNFKYICSVGRLSEEKGFDRLIESYYKLKKEGEIGDLKLLIIGSGKDKNKLNELVRKLKLEEYIIFVPFSKNPYKYIKNSEFFVSSSRVEGYPTVVLEALVLKKIVVATDTGASSILNNGEFGLVVSNNTDGIIKGIKEVMDRNSVYARKALLGEKMVLNENKEKLERIIEVINGYKM